MTSCLPQKQLQNHGSSIKWPSLSIIDPLQSPPKILGATLLYILEKIQGLQYCEMSGKTYHLMMREMVARFLYPSTLRYKVTDWSWEELMTCLGTETRVQYQQTRGDQADVEFEFPPWRELTRDHMNMISQLTTLLSEQAGRSMSCHYYQLPDKPNRNTVNIYDGDKSNFRFYNIRVREIPICRLRSRHLSKSGNNLLFLPGAQLMLEMI